MLVIQDVHKRYGKVKALRGVNIAIKDRTTYGIIGPPSSGKTSILKMCAGLLRPDSGRIEFNGKNLLEIIQDLHEMVGYMPEGFGLYNDMTIEQYLMYFVGIYVNNSVLQKQKTDKLLKFVGLYEVKNEEIDNISRGAKQKLSLARALVNNPKYLFLDQPFKGLDPYCKDSVRDLIKILNKQGTTIVLATETLDEVKELCTKVSIIENGSIIMDGKIQDIFMKIHDRSKLIIEVVDGKEKAVEILKKNIYVERTTVEKNHISITFKGNRYMESMLLKELVENHVLVAAFNREKKDFDDVFVKITKSMNGGFDE